MTSKLLINIRFICIFWVVFISYALVVFIDPHILDDGDAFLHVAAGQWILQHHAVPQTDPFSYSFAGMPWVAHEWLAELLMACAYGWAGWGGVLILTGLAYALAMGSMAVFFVQRGASLLSTALVFASSFVLTLPSLLARPHILALPCFVIWSILLLNAREKGNAPPPWPSVFILLIWINLHGSFAIGLSLIFPFALEAIVVAKHARLHVMGAWVRFFALSCVAVAFSPNGWRGLLFPVQLVMMPQLTSIREWAPMHLQLTEPFVLIFCALVYVAITRRLRLSPVRWLLVAGFIYLSVRHVRYELLAAVFVPLILASPLGKLASGYQGAGGVWHVSTMQWLALVGVVGGLTELRTAFPFVLPDGPSSPIAALARIPEELCKLPVLNSYRMGGFLIFEHIKPIMDGRADIYGNAFMKEYLALMKGDKALLQAWSREFDLRWAYLEPTEKLVNVLDADPQWKRLYTDKYGIVYVKEKFSRIDYN